MSSHREAIAISQDPVADSTDLYAWVSPDKPRTVTLIANYVPLQSPDGGPNFYEFGDDVLYEIHIDNDGDGEADVTYQFRFDSVLQNPDSFLYNTGPITVSPGGVVDTSNWNRRQSFSVVRIDRQRRKGSPRRGVLLGSDLACPPCNIGPLSTPGYDPSSSTPDALTRAFTHTLSSGETVFAGQRAEGFYVDLGSIFDVGDLRPFAGLHNTFGLPVLSGMPGVNATKALNVHSIAVQVDKEVLTADGSTPRDPTAPASVVGVWTTASRQKVRVWEADAGDHFHTGPWAQVSRLGNPLVNEVIIALGDKDRWNSVPPSEDQQFLHYFQNPELARLLPALYHQPSSTTSLFPNLAALNAQIAAPGSSVTREDLVAILLTGIPPKVIKGFQNFTGAKPADMLRLNLAIPPSSSPNNLGLLGNDVAGFPNGRRVFDDVTTIELRAIAGATYPLVHPSFTPDGAASLVTDDLTNGPSDVSAKGTIQYLTRFPYLGSPHSGYTNPAS
ncbi:MAG: DUF4331 domain-containing protein [Acidimicrobiia bacterium]|nr:DUF4331 domain-containing protein [Acidimicrobiia bacterium]